MASLDHGRARKRIKLLPEEDAESSSSEGSQSGSAPLKINQEYARRFEHNSRRAELHRLEEKYGKETAQSKVEQGREKEDESDGSSSTSTDEDDEGILASAALDEEFNATLQAIRNKDPRVYDTKTTFYAEIDDSPIVDTAKKDKPMYLQDYHRENLLRGTTGADGSETGPTYVQEQAQLKQAVIKELNDAAARADSDPDDDGDFLVAKERPAAKSEETAADSPRMTATEVENAAANPDAFLSKLMASRAWAKPADPASLPFQSDDEEEDERAEAIEEAYNFRFEDPSKANEKLVSHARDFIEKQTVRKEAPSRRQRAREAEKESKQAEKEERKLERARLRKLRVDEAQEKLDRIKDAAGSRARELKLDEWEELLGGDWDEEEWETEMHKKFDDTYYAEPSGDEEGGITTKPKKPKWSDDIEVTDLVPDFDDGDAAAFSLSDDDPTEDAPDAVTAPTTQRTKKDKKKDKLAAKNEKRKERRQLEQIVEAQLDHDLALRGPDSGTSGATFRYRATSPMAFGMSSQDILFASDKQLNQYAGIKKLASFRDSEKKKRDKKRLGKKARLREWRKETFGSERGPRQNLQDVIREQLAAKSTRAEEPTTRPSAGRNRKRSANHASS